MQARDMEGASVWHSTQGRAGALDAGRAGAGRAGGGTQGPATLPGSRP